MFKYQMPIYRNISYLIILLLFTQALKAQYINKRIGFSQGAAEVGWNAVENDSGYMMIGGTVPGIPSIGVVQTDFNGNVLFQKTYMDTNFAFYAGFQGSLQQVSSGGYVLFGGRNRKHRSK
jgi:hypothetical protein